MIRLSPTARICLLLASLVGTSSLSQAEKIDITFRLISPDLAEDAQVYLTGNVSGLGHWKPDATRMTYAGDHQWTYQLVLSEAKRLEYKYTLGSWTIEGADATGNPLQNFTHAAQESTNIQDRIDFWTKPQAREIQGQITGTVKYHRQLSVNNIRPRDVIVWLPPNYDASNYDTSNERYPVLYMHDGQNIINPKTSAFGVDWQIDETCTRLIEEQVIPPLMVVGIYNSPDRTKEYLPGPPGTAYMDFVVNQIKPFIDQNYRTKPSREYTLVGGSSAGGLAAFMLAWEHPEVFSKALCMSPAFKLENAEQNFSLDYVATVEQSQAPTGSLVFYIDNGGIGLEQELQPGIDEMLKALHAQGLVLDKEVRWVHAIDDRHSEAAWARRFPAAIEFLLGRTADRRGDPATE